MNKKIFSTFTLICVLAILLNILISALFTKHFFGSLIERRNELLEIYQYQFYLSRLKDAETGERGFIITGDSDYLEPYNTALAYLNSPNTQEFIATESNDPNPEIAATMKKVDELVKIKLAELAEIIQIRKEQGFEPAQRRVQENKGKIAMDNLRSLINSIIQKKQRKIDLLDNKIKREMNNTILFLIVANSFVALFLGLCLYSIYRSMIKLEKKDKELSSTLQQLSDSFATQDAIINSVNYAIISVNREGIIQSFNSAAEKMLNYRKEEIINKYTPIIIHDSEEIEKEAIALSKKLHRKVVPGFDVFTVLADQGIPYTREWTYIRKDGSRFPISLSVTSIKNIQNQIIGYVGIIYDITERQKIDQMKNELIAVTSHEIRSPVAVIKGTLDLLSQKEYGFSDEVKKILSIGQKNCHHLIHLIEDIVNIQKIEIGQVKFNLKKVYVAAFLSQVIQSNNFIAQRSRVLLICPTTIPSQWAVEADEDRLMQVMNNLISNAISHTPEGKAVEIGAQKVDSKIRFEIKDQGGGIPEEFHSKIFQKFATSISSHSPEKKGIGLGLNIAKAIIEKHKGFISFETSSQGTIFWFELPALETT